MRPIIEVDDWRINQLKSIYEWFRKWEVECNGKQNMLMSKETREDLASLVLSFISLFENRINKTGWGTVPARFNSDIVENIFCQQRGINHGNNTNPTHSDYQYGTNSIVLEQILLTKKRKSNCSTQPAPYSIAIDRPLKQSKPNDNSWSKVDENSQYLCDKTK